MKVAKSESVDLGIENFLFFVLGSPQPSVTACLHLCFGGVKSILLISEKGTLQKVPLCLGHHYYIAYFPSPNGTKTDVGGR